MEEKDTDFISEADDYKEEKKINKKAVIIIVTIVIILIIAVLFLFRDKTKSYERIMTKYAKDYYENYIVKINADNYKVTLDALKEANNNGANYNLSKIKCSDSSYIILITSGNNITKTKGHMKCN